MSGRINGGQFSGVQVTRGTGSLSGPATQTQCRQFPVSCFSTAPTLYDTPVESGKCNEKGGTVCLFDKGLTCSEEPLISLHVHMLMVCQFINYPITGENLIQWIQISVQQCVAQLWPLRNGVLLSWPIPTSGPCECVSGGECLCLIEQFEQAITHFRLI